MFELIILAIIQGVTEFFPISSSGHLVQFQSLFNFNPSETLELNVLLHLATFFSILIYFKDQIISLVYGIFQRRPSSIQLMNQIIVATIPAAIFGFGFKDAISGINSTLTVSIFFLVAAVIFLYCEAHKEKFQVSNPYLFAILIGLAQAFALFPGISRSGITLAIAILIGANRIKGAEFSFLIGLPAILGAGLLTFMDSPNLANYLTLNYAIIFLTCFAVGFISIKYLMQFYKNHTLKPFAFYLIGIGLVLIAA